MLRCTLTLTCLLLPMLPLAAPALAGEPACATTPAMTGPATPEAVLTEAPARLLPRAPSPDVDVPLCMSPEHIFLHEDTGGVLARPHTFGELNALKARAANAVIAAHGDAFDFYVFWTPIIDAGSRVGGAHYSAVRNDVEGIGKLLFDNHASFGLEGTRTQGFIMMYDLHVSRASTAPKALAHEFWHRWVVSLRRMPDGRAWGGGHFNCLVDQNGGIHGAEWHGLDPANGRGNPTRNFDTGETFSYLNLYLAGYATAEEMDAGMEEQRYMDDIDQPAGECLKNYRGPVSTWSSADLIATNGPRVPSADAGAQKDFTAAHVLLHQPGQPPRKNEVGRLVRIAEGFNQDWVAFTLGRGTLNTQLFQDADCDGLPD